MSRFARATSGMLLPLVLVLLLASTSATDPEGPGAPEEQDSDPILEALTERLAASPAAELPAGSAARLRLDVLDLAAGAGTRALGRFTAPLDPQRPARLARRVDLQDRGGLAPLSLDVEIEIRSIPLGPARARFEIESRVRTAGAGEPRVRRESEELGAGRSSLIEAFQVPGTSRRLMLALSWDVVPLDPAAEPAYGVRPAPPAQMVDLQLSLVRLHENSEEPLKQQRISTGLGAEARSLLRIIERPLMRDEAQQIEVRLTPRSVDPSGLLLGIEVQGALQGDEDAPGIWINHRDEARIGSGRRYSLNLGGDGTEDGSAVTYRLDIRPYY